MIDVIFDPSARNTSVVAGAYQYDTGQRMRLFGLPSPAELAERDELLSGETVSMMAQFAYVGDSQTESRLGQYNEDGGYWLVDVPDEYLLRHEAVDVYLYVGYGYTGDGDEQQSRGQTAYTVSFVPIPRAAPSDTVSPEQITAWNALVSEVNLAINNMVQTGEKVKADTAAAIAAANSAYSAQFDKLATWMQVTAEATDLPYGSTPTAEASEQEGRLHFAFGLVQGKQGEVGPVGPQGPQGADGHSDLSISYNSSTKTLTINHV